ncbi:MAG: NAD-dependent epimerase/dehydratase family protein [Nitrospiraceae bacterium]|nr:MAG: NAD-dependent epimerase/dehydratase family protein [Nitrospiraceae bacterium]
MERLELKADDRVLILGATGFIGRRLVTALAGMDIKLRLMARSPSKTRGMLPEGKDIEVLQGDLMKNQDIRAALEGIYCAYYLVHSMGGKSIARGPGFADQDKKAAGNFKDAAGEAGLKRVIYLGGLGEKGQGLSEHLSSRAEVADILSSGKTAATILRAAVIIGAGGASFEMLRYLVERLPVMICPKWINTRIQPVAVKDVIAYLCGCLVNPDTAGKTYDIGGPEVLTYRGMMDQYAEARGLAKRIIIDVPLLTPSLSSYWVDLVTPVPAGIAHPLIEGLKNEVVCRDSSIDTYVPITKTPFKEAVKIAFSEETSGPGVTGF